VVSLGGVKYDVFIKIYFKPVLLFLPVFFDPLYLLMSSKWFGKILHRECLMGFKFGSCTASPGGGQPVWEQLNVPKTGGGNNDKRPTAVGKPGNSGIWKPQPEMASLWFGSIAGTSCWKCRKANNV